jgi:HAD superfamily hydrolase (TIGR01490 family)
LASHPAVAAVSASVPLAAFDLDGTVLRGQSGALWAWHLAGRRLVPARTALRVAALLVRYRRGAPLDYDRLAAELLASFEGRPTAAFEALIDPFVEDRLLPTVRREARATMARLRAGGCHVVLASAALAPLVARLARRLPADGWIATELAPPVNGAFAGRLNGPVRHGAAKLDALAAYADARFSAWHLEHAFTDHESDLALLEAARRPTAVNPSPGLKRIARERRWPIAPWR